MALRSSLPPPAHRPRALRRRRAMSSEHQILPLAGEVRRFWSTLVPSAVTGALLRDRTASVAIPRGGISGPATSAEVDRRRRRSGDRKRPAGETTNVDRSRRRPAASQLVPAKARSSTRSGRAGARRPLIPSGNVSVSTTPGATAMTERLTPETRPLTAYVIPSRGFTHPPARSLTGGHGPFERPCGERDR